MQAIVCRSYGPPESLRLEEVPVPVPADDEVLIRVHAASVNPIDRTYRGRPYALRAMLGWTKPKDPGVGRDLAGTVEAIGKSVTRFKAGDEVFGVARGAFAEYACAGEGRLALKPANVSFEEAAAVPIAGITALQALRDQGAVQAGQKVLINGAAGGVGSFAVQIAKWLGAEVTAVCSTQNVERVRALGADRVIDYSKEDFTRSADRYDVVCDCVGNHSLRACCRALQPEGLFLGVGAATLRHLLAVKLASPLVRQRVTLVMAKLKGGALETLAELLAARKIVPLIDRRYPLADAAAAFQRLETRHAQGKLIITLTA